MQDIICLTASHHRMPATKCLFRRFYGVAESSAQLMPHHAYTFDHVVVCHAEDRAIWIVKLSVFVSLTIPSEEELADLVFKALNSALLHELCTKGGGYLPSPSRCRSRWSDWTGWRTAANQQTESSLLIRGFPIELISP